MSGYEMSFLNKQKSRKQPLWKQRQQKAIDYARGRVEQAIDDGTYVKVGNEGYLPVCNLTYIADILEGKVRRIEDEIRDE